MLTAIKTYYVQKDTVPEEFSFPLDHLTPKILKEYGVEKLSNITKLFFDYDQNFKEDGSEQNQLESTVKELRDLLKEHSTKYTNGFVYTEAVQPNKISFHVIFTHHSINRATFQPELEYDLFSTIVGEERFKHIDTEVYHKKLWFRLPYGTVYNKPYPHVPHNISQPLRDYCISLPETVVPKCYETHPYTINKKFEHLTNKYKYADIKDEEGNLNERQERIIHLLELIKPERFKVQKHWFQLMCLIRGNDISIGIFIKLSKDSGYKAFNEAECIKQFNLLKVKATFGFPLIHKWCEEDGVDWKTLYPSLSPIVRAVKNLELKDFGCTDFGLAKILHEFYKDDLYYAKGFGWIHYNEDIGMWEHGTEALIIFPIMRILSTDLCIYTKSRILRLGSKLNKLKDLPKEEKVESIKIEIKILELKVTNLHLDTMKKYRHIQSAGCINSVLKVAQTLFTNDTILDTFNAKPYLFTFKNGISINLFTGEEIKVTKEQHILVTCGYDLPERKQEDLDLVETLMKTIIPAEEYDSFMKNTSIFLYGNNSNECIIFWKGIGRNGKGVAARILEHLLGLYFQALPITELTEESKGKGGTSSELALARFARCLMATEPEGNHTFKTGSVKRLTGCDKISVRQLYKEATSYLPQFTLCVQLNDEPTFSKLDDALIKRMHFESFPHQFVPVPILDYQRLLDDTLKQKIDTNKAYRNGLLWLLIDAFKASQGKLIRTITSEKANADWIDETNPLKVFLSNYKPSEDFIKIKELRDAYNDSYSKDKLSTSSFKHNLLLCKLKITEDHHYGTKVYIERK